MLNITIVWSDTLILAWILLRLFGSDVWGPWVLHTETHFLHSPLLWLYCFTFRTCEWYNGISFFGKKKEQKNKSVTNQCKYFKIKIALTSLKFVFFFEYYLNDSLVSQFSHQKKPESVHWVNPYSLYAFKLKLDFGFILNSITTYKLTSLVSYYFVSKRLLWNRCIHPLSTLSSLGDEQPYAK